MDKKHEIDITKKKYEKPVVRVLDNTLTLAFGADCSTTGSSASDGCVNGNGAGSCGGTGSSAISG
jgi:hypothetical protein